MEPNRFSENLNWDNAQIAMRLVTPEDCPSDLSQYRMQPISPFLFKMEMTPEARKAQEEATQKVREVVERFSTIAWPTPLPNDYEFGIITEEARQRLQDTIATWKAKMEQAPKEGCFGIVLPSDMDEKLGVIHEDWATDPLGWSRHINYELAEVRRNIANTLYWASDLLQDLGNWILGNRE